MPRSRRTLTDGLSAAAAFAAWEFISGPLVVRTRAVGTRLRAPSEGIWRANRGEYRVRHQINEDRHHVVVLDIDHRRDAYRS